MDIVEIKLEHVIYRTLFWTERGSDYTIYTLSLNQPSKPMILRMAVNKITALFFDVTANRYVKFKKT